MSGYIYILLSALIFSTMEIAGKMVATQINPFQLNFIRFLIGGLILLPFAFREVKKRKIEFKKQDIKYFLVTGMLCVFISMTFFQMAIVYAKASTVAIVFSTNPVFTIPFAYLILKEKLNKATFISLTASILGIICILNPFNIDKDLKGINFAILAALSFSLYSVFGKSGTEKYGSIIFNCITFLVGDFIMLLFIASSHVPVISSLYQAEKLPMFADISITAGINSSNIFILMYLGIVVTGLGYIFYFIAMEKTSVATGAIVFFIKPALASILSFIVLGEKISLNKILGILFIIIGAYITFENKNYIKSKK